MNTTRICLLLSLLFFLATASSSKKEEEENEKSKSKSEEYTGDQYTGDHSTNDGEEDAAVTEGITTRTSEGDEDTEKKIRSLGGDEDAACASGTIYTNLGESCTVPCRVTPTNPMLTQVPQVSWYLKSFEFKGKTKYLSINDAKGWDLDYKQQQCVINQPQRRNFSEASSKCELFSENGVNRFKCDLILKRCEDGEFLCRVEFEDNSIVEKNASVCYGGGDRDQTSPICFHPTARNFSSRLLSNSDIEVTWISSPRKDHFDREICKNKPEFCQMSRKYYAKMLVYHTVPYDETAEPSEKDELKNKKSNTNRTFHYSSTTNGKYFQFQVRNSRLPGLTPHIDLPTETVTTSGLFYFGEQENAKLTNPLRDEIHTLDSHELIEITCSGAGKPAPRITLSIEQNGIKKQQCDKISTCTKPWSLDHPIKVYCEAINYVVNADGELERKVDSRTIIYNIAQR